MSTVCSFGATTLSITTLSITTLSITTLSITTLSITTRSITTLSTRHTCDTQHKWHSAKTTLSLITLYYYAHCRYAECRYAECRYAECRYAECRYAECRYAEHRGAILLTVRYPTLIFTTSSVNASHFYPPLIFERGRS